MLKLPLRVFLGLAITICGVISTPFAASADSGHPQCAARTEQLTYLKEKFGEVPEVSGTTANGLLLIVTANRKTGTWSILFQQGDGPACFRATGDGWRTQALSPADPAI